MTFPQHRVEIAFTTDPLSLNPAWEDITEAVLQASIRRGRSHELEEFRAGEATLLLLDEDCSCVDGVHTCGCRFNPIVNPNMRARKRVRILADHPDLEQTALVYSGNSTDRATKASFSSWPTTALTFESWIAGTGAASGNNSQETAVSYFATNRQFVVKNLRNLAVRVNNSEVVTGVDVHRGDDFAHHLAVSWRSSDGLLRVYVDGVMRFETFHQQGATLNTGGTFVLGQEQTSLGGGFSATTALKGTMRDVRLWSVARTHHAIFHGMHRTFSPPVTGLLSYWRVDEGAGTTLTDLADGNDLTVTGATWGEQVWRSARFDGYIESIGNVYDGSTVQTVDVRCVDALGLVAQFRELRSPYRQTVIDQGPQLYWPLDDGGKQAKDLSGNGLDGTYMGNVQQGIAAPFPLADSGRGARFTSEVGTSLGRVAELTATAGNFERTDPFSLSLLLRWNGDPMPAGLLRFARKSSGWSVSLVHAGVRFELVRETSVIILRTDGLRQFLDSHWHHLSVTYDGSSTPGGIRHYIDGELLGTTTIDNAPGGTILNAFSFMLTAISSLTAGTIDMTHFALFSRVLSAPEVRAQYEAAFNPWASDRSDVRADRYLEQLNWPFRDMWRGVSTISAVGDSLGNALRRSQELAVAERSGFYATERGDLALDDRFVNSYQSPVLDEFGGDELGFTFLEPALVDLDLGTEVYATARDTPAGPSLATDAAAESAFAPIAVTITAPWSDDDQARDVADRTLARLTSGFVRIAGISPTGEPCEECEDDRGWGRLLSLRLHRDVVRVFRDLGPSCGPNALVLSGAGDFASTPDHASLDITGDIDIRVTVSPDSWEDGQFRGFVAKTSIANQYAWQFGKRDNNDLQMLWTTDGTFGTFNDVTAPFSFPAGTSLHLRSTVDVDNGSGQHVVTFYSKPVGSNPTAERESNSGWTVIATVTQAGTVTFFSGTSPVTVGVGINGGNQLLGKVLGASVRSGINGTVVADPDFLAQAPGTTSFQDSTGKTWTLQGNAHIAEPTLDRNCWVEGMEETYRGCELQSMKWSLVQASPDVGSLFLVGRSALNSGDVLA